MTTASLLPRDAGIAVLRRFHAQDLAAFQEYRQDPRTGQFQGWSPMSHAQALAFIHEMAVADLFVPGAWIQLAVARAGDDALVGDIGLCVLAGGELAEIGYTITPAAQGQGYGSAAVSAAIGLVFEQTAVRKVLGITDARNTPSARLLERVGMRREESRDTVFRGERCVEWVYAVRRGLPASSPCAVELRDAPARPSHRD